MDFLQRRVTSTKVLWRMPIRQLGRLWMKMGLLGLMGGHGLAHRLWLRCFHHRLIIIRVLCISHLRKYPGECFDLCYYHKLIDVLWSSIFFQIKLSLKEFIAEAIEALLITYDWFSFKKYFERKKLEKMFLILLI